MDVATIIELARRLWPALTTAVATDDTLTAWYPTALSRAGATWFGADRQTAVAHLVAHFGMLSDPNRVPGAGGILSSVTTKSRSMSWSPAPNDTATSAWDAELMTTAPGRAYRSLARSSLESAPFMVEDDGSW